jgi:hypothetical protein
VLPIADYAIAGVAGLDLHLYRAMAWLGEELPEKEQDGRTPFAPRCLKDAVEERLFAHRRDLLTRLDLVFYASWCSKAPSLPLVISKRGKEIDYEAKTIMMAGRRYIVCRNHQEAEKDAADRLRSWRRWSASSPRATRS